jgi:hypothetical protein
MYANLFPLAKSVNCLSPNHPFRTRPKSAFSGPVLTLGVLFSLLGSYAFVSNITLALDQSTDPEVNGYELCMDAPSQTKMNRPAR